MQPMLSETKLNPCNPLIRLIRGSDVWMVAFVLLSSLAFSQHQLPRNFQAAVANKTRTMTGEPGTFYWQNKADYNIHIKFTPKSRKIVGTETITYYNNSPDTLKMIVMSLFPNLYKKGTQRETEIELKDQNEGVKITKLLVTNETLGTSSHGAGTIVKSIEYFDYTKDASIKENLDGTWLYLTLQKPIPPRQSASLRVDWNYVLNKGSHIRTGEISSGAYFVAYCFPRIAVYDDMDGWNRNAYNGKHEFYNDFSNFNVTLELPRGYLCWATGENENRPEVVSELMEQRRVQMFRTREPVVIYDPTNKEEANALVAKHKKSKTIKWQFRANNVTDFTWACSNKYKWVAAQAMVDGDTKTHRQINVAHDPSHDDFDSVVHFTRSTIELLSHTFPAIPYPYPHCTVVEGLAQMEYPMMVNDNRLEGGQETIELTVHEVAHMYMPFICGTNETEYAWMDEGWATYCEHVFSKVIDTTNNNTYGLAPFRNFSGHEEMPDLSTPSHLLTGQRYFVNAYAKPGIMMHVLEQTLGIESFRSLYHEFITTWSGKHPTQYDWFNFMRSRPPVNANMEMFIDRWFYSFAYPDYKLTVQSLPKGSMELKIENIGKLPYPLLVEITYTDKRVEQFWTTKYFNPMKDEAVFDMPFPSGTPGKIRIHNPWVWDVNPKDNEVKF